MRANRLRTIFAVLCALLVAACNASPESNHGRGPIVLAAASLQEALSEAAGAWTKAGHPAPALSFAGSSALARQVESGARADIFVSADEEWMDELARKGLVREGSRQTLLGNALTLSIGNDLPQHLVDIENFSELPIGVAVHGDGEAVRDVIAKIEDALGGRLSDLGIGAKTSDDRLVLSTSEDYADALLEKGGLGAASAFRAAVPEADKSFFVLYLNFDSRLRDTLIQLAEDEGEDADLVRDLRENTDPLRSLGISAWQDGGDSHFLLKIATD